jgi:hypothetical protein
LDVSQYSYAAFVGAVLVAIAAVWLVLRLRNRGGPPRIEPGMGTKAQDESPVFKTEMASDPDDDETPAPVSDVLMDAKTELSPEFANKVPDRPAEQGYKGFKIQLREKQPGLWVALIADSTPRNRKRQAEDRRASVTREYYQLPAALAEAKVLIDRRLAARH